MEETVRSVKPRSVLRQQAVFEEGGETGIFLSAGAYMVGKARNFPKYHRLFSRGKIKIFLIPIDFPCFSYIFLYIFHIFHIKFHHISHIFLHIFHTKKSRDGGGGDSRTTES